MRIQTNTAANSALGYMRVNSQNTERSIQKLSSGFRINRAADDAAGLAIANQLRADAKTLGQAQKNAAQAGAMLQIADGAGSTLGGIFDRMRELASQGASANIGASSNAQKLQDEWNALYKEADRIISGTKYQGTNVLTGLRAQTTQNAAAGTGAFVANTATVPPTAAPSTGASGVTNGVATTVGSGASAVNAQNGAYTFAMSGSNVVATRVADGATASVSQTPVGGKLSFASLGLEITTGSGYSTGAATPAAATGATGVTVSTAQAGAATGLANGAYTITDDGSGVLELRQGNATGAVLATTTPASGATSFTFTGTGANAGVSLTVGTSAYTPTTSGNASTHGSFTFANAVAAGSNSLAGTQLNVTGGVQARTASDAPSILVGTSASQGGSSYGGSDSIKLELGTLDDNAIRNLSNVGNFEAGGNTAGASLLSTAGAQDALTRLDAALGSLNTFVGKLGAAQSRVDYATQNVNSMLQNTLAAESSIRDADMAAEMTTFTKNNILQQAAQSMLAQANQGSQGILQLLRG